MAVTGWAPAPGGAGTPESYWAQVEPLADLPRWAPSRPASGRVVVLAPHPDDEVLGPGGTVARLVAEGARLRVVAVTDGERSHAGRAEQLRRQRPAETAAALGALGVPADRVDVVRLRLPDSAVSDLALGGLLEPLVDAGDLVLAPWARDGHPDHDAVGRAARLVCAERAAPLLEYLVWAWEWATEDDLPWSTAVRVELASDVAARKRAAVDCFRSQIEGPRPVLPPAVLAHLVRPFEMLLRS